MVREEAILQLSEVKLILNQISAGKVLGAARKRGSPLSVNMVALLRM